ncbi:MAG: two-component system response regulator [Lysobacterales bacterium CG02_land_8_20_14_3_00_62_12]|nr:MAG: two-component system response regulator [Xanthomonadales bacterium CG02_land_8_20_14_3_00_62_12]
MKPRSLLLIDDDQDYCTVLQRALGRRGYEVVSANDADSAMLQAAARPFDGLILDLRLGEDSGLQLLAGLRRHQAKARILLLTGYASIATAVDAIKRGADQYLPKPAQTDAILVALFGPAVAPTVPITPTHPRRLEWEHLQRVMAEYQGNVSAAARALGLHRRTLQRKLGRTPPDET